VRCAPCGAAAELLAQADALCRLFEASQALEAAQRGGSRDDGAAERARSRASRSPPPGGSGGAAQRTVSRTPADERGGSGSKLRIVLQNDGRETPGRAARRDASPPEASRKRPAGEDLRGHLDAAKRASSAAAASPAASAPPPQDSRRSAASAGANGDAPHVPPAAQQEQQRGTSLRLVSSPLAVRFERSAPAPTPTRAAPAAAASPPPPMPQALASAAAPAPAYVSTAPDFLPLPPSSPVRESQELTVFVGGSVLPLALIGGVDPRAPPPLPPDEAPPPDGDYRALMLRDAMPPVRVRERCSSAAVAA
jgi:hypothetical protein